jgi:hypothetical protein
MIISGEADGRLVAVTGVGVIVGELARLLGDGLGDLHAAVAHVNAVEPGEGVQALAALAVDDRDPLAALDDACRRLAPSMRAHGRRGMEQMVTVRALERVAVGQAGGGHSGSLLTCLG